MKQISKSFGSSSEKRAMTKYVFLHINHTITQPKDRVAAFEFPLLCFDTSCGINVNPIFLLITVLETYIMREQDTMSKFFRSCHNYFFSPLRCRLPTSL